MSDKDDKDGKAVGVVGLTGMVCVSIGVGIRYGFSSGLIAFGAMCLLLAIAAIW